MSKTNAPHGWTATETLAELHSRRIVAVELFAHMTGRFQKLAPQVNSVIETRMDLARSTAKADDNGEISGPLAGLPMTIKDTYEVKGFGCTGGMPELKDYRSVRDADAVARLRKAGAVFWGKTNMPVAAVDHQSYNPIFGVTNNPWDSAARLEAHQAALLPRWRQGSPRSNSAVTLAARSGYRRISVACGVTGRAMASFRSVGGSRPIRARWSSLRCPYADLWRGTRPIFRWLLTSLLARYTEKPGG
ncbi:amidase family protein [Rhizobium oryzicola]|uniref:Amidase family protein n=1 Tax=Rhizobium oryzicola TaxID=1232668 RepID=A0ABT8SZ78_9HYPH|nr:amidase family protein [Rhizobium oryzicola]MDO1583353.1 amidase family protein [Rhizobium oryzicola]